MVLSSLTDRILEQRQNEPSKTLDAAVVEINPTPPTSEPDMATPTPAANPDSSHHFRDLINKLSIDEKVALLAGSSFTETTGIPRLSIPRLKVSDSINGVRGSQSHLENRGTACFPSTTCLASTWNTELLHHFGHEVGLQAKLKAVQVVIGPNINLHRDPRRGRNFETFSEDPLLTGTLAASIVNGMQSTGVGACAKHFVGNESETKRCKYNVSTSANSRTMRELYMKAFQIMLRDSNPVSIMMAYNKVEGHYCSQTPLIQDVLRNAWKYDGCLMSDWYGTRAGVESLHAGLDLEMSGPSVFRGKKLLEELSSGSVTEAEINRAARSVLKMIDRTAESHSDSAEQVVVCERTSSMAWQLAVEGIVLLKNEQNFLPLDIGKAQSIAVIGAPVYSEDLDTSQVVMLGRLKPGLNQQDFHYVITATLSVPVTGKHTLGAQVTGDFALDLDGHNILKGAAPNITVEDFLFVPKKLERTTQVLLEAGRQYRIRLLVHSRKSANNGEPTPHAAKLVFQEAFDNRQSIADAVSIAARSDTSIIFAGRTHENKSEGFDLDTIALDANQIRLIKAVSAVSERTVLVLHHGNPIDLSPVIDDVEAVIAAHFPGQEGASALLEIIIGRMAPSGRLATTWPLKFDESCVPSFNNFPCPESSDPEISYNEGLQLGYRHPSASLISRFPFGHGLSYSQFEISNLNVDLSPSQDDLPYAQRRLTVTLRVSNRGAYPGKHVVQLYIEAPQASPESVEPMTDTPGSGDKSDVSVWRPRRELISFAKPYLVPGETKTVEMTFLLRDVTSTWDEGLNCWRARGGKYAFVVADGSADLSVDAGSTGSCRTDIDLSGDGELWNGL